jgi:hypothetical protein
MLHDEGKTVIPFAGLFGDEMDWQWLATAKQGGDDLENCGESESMRKRRNGGGLPPLGACAGISPRPTWVNGVDRRWHLTMRWHDDRVATGHMVGAGGTDTSPGGQKEKSGPLTCGPARI